MNPLDAILESRHRWTILAGASFVLACIGAMMMLAYGWPHLMERIWFYAGVVVAIYCLGRGFLQWKEAVEAALDHAARQEKQSALTTEDPSQGTAAPARDASAAKQLSPSRRSQMTGE